MKYLSGLAYLKQRADSGDKHAEEMFIQAAVEDLMKPVMPMIAMRVRLIMEEVFEQTRKKYKTPKETTAFQINVIEM